MLPLLVIITKQMQCVTRMCHACFRRTFVTNGDKVSATENQTPLRRLLDEASSFGETEAAASEPELRWATQPYAARPPTPRRDNREREEPRDTTILLFPGQGSQQVGMGRRLLEIPAAKQLYELASSVVGWDVARVCAAGPEEELARRCQTAVLVTSLAALERAREERPGALERVRAAAGFSLGEIAALVFADALPLERALRLVELRAAAMRAAAAERPGAMLTVWLAPDARLAPALQAARDHAHERGVAAPVCQVANYLYPGCKVLAGDEAALRWLEARGAAWGVRRSARVRVEGAFHSPLMARAEAALREAVRAVEARAPRLAVWSCVSAAPYRDARDVQRLLPRHVTRPVRWEQTLQALYARPRGEGFPLTLTLGPGQALRSTLRQNPESRGEITLAELDTTMEGSLVSISDDQVSAITFIV